MCNAAPYHQKSQKENRDPFKPVLPKSFSTKEKISSNVNPPISGVPDYSIFLWTPLNLAVTQPFTDQTTVQSWQQPCTRLSHYQ